MHVWYLSFIASLDLRGCAHTALVCTVCIVAVTVRISLISSERISLISSERNLHQNLNMLLSVRFQGTIKDYFHSSINCLVFKIFKN